MERRLRLCGAKGCTVALLPFAKKWCPEHAKRRRAKQLAAAQERYYERARTGKGTPPSRRQLLRNGLPTRWARENPKLALKEWHRRFPGEGLGHPVLVEALVTVR